MFWECIFFDSTFKGFLTDSMSSFYQLFNPVSKNDTGEYYCEADNKIGQPQKCPVMRMQVGKCQTQIWFQRKCLHYKTKLRNKKKNKHLVHIPE